MQGSEIRVFPVSRSHPVLGQDPPAAQVLHIAMKDNELHQTVRLI